MAHFSVKTEDGVIERHLETTQSTLRSVTVSLQC